MLKPLEGSYGESRLNDHEEQLERAIADHRLGNVGAAERVYRKILSVDPDHVEARHMMGVVHLQGGRFREAEEEIQQALLHKGNSAKFNNTLGSVLVQQGRFHEALSAFEISLSNEPVFTTAAYNRGTVLLTLGKPREAETAFRTVLGTGENYRELFINLANALVKQARIREATQCCREGLAIHPGDPELKTTLASTLELSNDLAAAEKEAREVCDKFPEFTLAHLIVARVLRRHGELDEAFKTLEPAFSVVLAPTDEAEVNYELGLIQDARNNPTEAFGYFSRSNFLQRRLPAATSFDGDRYLDKVRAYRKWIGGASRPAPAPIRDTSPAPVFFVGFPRSGTTLMEQMLKAHPNIVTTGEVSPLGPVEDSAIRLAAKNDLSYPESLDVWNEDVLAELRLTFSSEVERLFGSLDGKLLIDKLPLNIVLLGLVEKLWPNARVLVALRDPRDACLSCFIQRFALNGAMVNFLDIERTAITYAEVMGLWLQYRETLVLPWHEYRYEDLVDDFESTVRQVLDFIGVDWHPSVLSYREAAKQRVINTPSYREVTAPIHKKALQRWKGYTGSLTPILPALEPFVKQFGYRISHP